MRFDRRICVVGAGALVALAAFDAVAQPQDYPVKPIHIVVPLPPGGSNDVLARLLGQKMSESFGQPVIVENKPGAAGNIAFTPVMSGSTTPASTSWARRSAA